MRAFSKRSADSKSCIGFGIIPAVVSKNWNTNGRKPSAANLKILVGEFCGCCLEILRRNLLLNPELNERIQVIERAAWDESNVTIAVQGEGPGSHVSVGQTSASDASALTLAIDDLVTQWNLQRLDLIKMDIEGAELPALRGATRTIELFKPKMAISVYHRLTDFFEIPEFLDLLSVGYRFFLRHNSIHSEETVLFAEAGPR